MEQNLFLEEMNRQATLASLEKSNVYIAAFGLQLTREDMEVLLQEKGSTLRTQRRVEVGDSILPKLVMIFSDSPYLTQENLLETLLRLQEDFFLFKNEMEDEITDDELLQFMKEQFDGVCYGDLEYLEGTCLEIFAQAIRAGYDDYQEDEGYGVFPHLDIVPRWDRGLYLAALEDLLT